MTFPPLSGFCNFLEECWADHNFQVNKIDMLNYVWLCFLILKTLSQWKNNMIPNPNSGKINLKAITSRLWAPDRSSRMSPPTLTIWFGKKGGTPFFGVFDDVINNHFEFESKVLHHLLTCIHLGTSCKNFIQSGGDPR